MSIPMMKTRPQFSGTITAIALIALLAGDLYSQRRGFRRGRRRPPAEPTKKADTKKPEKKEIEKYIAITNATVYVGTGQILRRATVLIADDKIQKVGPGIDIPKKAEIIDAAGKFVSPGFVITAGSGMGSGSTAGEPKDSVNPYHPQIKMGLAAGITSFLVSGYGGATPSGNSAVFKLAFGDLNGMVLQKGCVLKMSVPLSMKQMKSFRDLIKKTAEYKTKKAEFEAKKNKTKKDRAPKAPRGADNIVKIQEGKAKLWIRGASNNDRLRQALKISTMLGTGIVLEDPTTAWSIPDEVAATGSMVILSPRTRVAKDNAHPDTTGSNIAMAAILSEVGVPVAVHPPSGRFGGGGLGTGGILGQDLNTPHVDAAFAVRGGLDNRKALRTITLDAAKMMGAAHRVGSIETGKDADILILDGEPLHYRSFVEIALVNGKVVYEKAKQPFYRHIKR